MDALWLSTCSLSQLDEAARPPGEQSAPDVVRSFGKIAMDQYNGAPH
jgi:hypothetical protein